MAYSSGGAGFYGPSDLGRDGQPAAPGQQQPAGAGGETTQGSSDGYPATRTWPAGPATPAAYPPTRAGTPHPPARADRGEPGIPATPPPGPRQLARREWNVPGYVGLKELGSGGFGDVVLARHDASGTLVAIKYVRRTLLDDPGFAELFRAEARVLASMDDPNVVRLYEYVESPAGAAIVMELVDGVSVRDILSRHGATTPEAALVVLQGSLLGLAAAHQRGVVHRDYKPENVLVRGDGVSKLSDFGIAARAGDRPVPAGTLAYAPPEQFAGGAASPAGDVYAATATFYECLTGRPPFRGDSMERMLYQHMYEAVPLDPVPAPLRPLVAAGMAKDPAYRPADAAAFVSTLRTAAWGAYGQDWEGRGRSNLGAAALLLTALWPSGGASAVHGSAVQQVHLSRHPGPSRESRHLRHLKHLKHLAHLRHLRVALAVAATAAVGAGVVVAAPWKSSPTSAATVCEPDGTGCTKAGTYPGPNAVINSGQGAAFKVVWTESVVQPYSSGVPLSWTAYVTYTNVSSSDQTLVCPGEWTNAAYITENMSGGKGDDGTVPAATTNCSEHPSLSVTVPPGKTYTSFATFHNVPWPGNAVALQWGDVGTSAHVLPFN